MSTPRIAHDPAMRARPSTGQSVALIVARPLQPTRRCLWRGGRQRHRHTILLDRVRERAHGECRRLAASKPAVAGSAAPRRPSRRQGSERQGGFTVPHIRFRQAGRGVLMSYRSPRAGQATIRANGSPQGDTCPNIERLPGSSNERGHARRCTPGRLIPPLRRPSRAVVAATGSAVGSADEKSTTQSPDRSSMSDTLSD